MSRHAVVTGGGSGIGRRTVERLLDDGWTVWAFDVAQASLDALRMGLNDTSRYREHLCDVASAASVAAAFAAVARETASLDALICSAGVATVGSLEQMTPQQVDRMAGVNVKGVWLSMREALPLLRKNAHVAAPAHVVVIGSISGMRPKLGSGMYAATKTAAHVLSEVFAAELAPSGVVVNVVAPGTVDTPMIQAAVQAAEDAGPAVRYKPSGASPLGRIGQPDDIADAILFLLSSASRYVNGVVLPVDGGTRAAFVKS